MKAISYNSGILNSQEQKLFTLDRELLGIVHALQIYGSPHPYSQIINLYYIVLQKKEISVHVFLVLKCHSQSFRK